MRTIRECVLQGRPVEATFIDVHGHYGPWPETVIPSAMDSARVLAEMDRFGCDLVWMSTSNPGYAGDWRLKNDLVFDLARKHPRRFAGYCTLSAWESGAANLAELKRCLELGPCVGVKMHRYRQPGYTMKSDFLQPCLELLQEHRLVYMNHAFPDIPALEWACERYPELIFMEGHFAGFYADLTLKHPNFVDCTCAALGWREVEKSVLKLGRSDTILNGSDFSLFTLAFGIGQIAFSDLPEPDQQAILGLNAVRLMKRMRWFDESWLSKETGGKP